MSVANQNAPASKLTHRSPTVVRLSPQFINRLSAHVRRTASRRVEPLGLLFGVTDETLVIIQAFKSFGSDATSAGVLNGDRLEQAFRDSVTAAQTDPEVSSLDLIGWYSMRGMGGLHMSDVEFHNRHFPQPAEVAMIVRPEAEGELLLELYTRATGALLSAEDHRWGSLRLTAGTPAVGPVEITMRTRIGDDDSWKVPQKSGSFYRAYGKETRRTGVRRRIAFPVLRSRQNRAEGERGTTSLRASRPANPAQPLGLTLGTRPPESAPEREPRPVEDSSAVIRRISAGPPPGLPALIVPKKRSIPWISMALLFVLAAAMTFAFFLARGFPTGAHVPAFLRPLFPGAALALRVEGQGDRVLLSWNRWNSAVRSAADGILHIDDGSVHRDFHLDASQLENGAVLYKPASDDVTFRLEVHGRQGITISESTRVLDGSKANAQSQSAPLDLSASPRTDSAPRQPASSSGERHAWTVETETKAVVPARQREAASPKTQSQDQQSTRSAAPLGSSLGERREATTQPTSPPGANATSTAPATGTRTDSTAAPRQATAGQLDPNAQRQQAPNTTDSGTGPGSSTLGSSTGEQRNAIPNAGAPAQNPASPAPSIQIATPENRSASLYVPPRPVRQMLPNTKFISPDAIAATPEIDVAVKIDKRGRVTQARIVNRGKKVKRALAGAAIAAAKQWLFDPARFQGDTVESEHTIVFQFQPPAQNQ